jgi:hypothetical protein
MGLHASVKDHLNALTEAPEWVVSLGEMIQRTEGCSAAIAASRARDLSQRKDIGGAIEGIARGWEILSACDLGSLTPLQRETIEVLVLNMSKELEAGLLQAGRIKR